MIVAFAEESIIPGKRLEIEQAHREADAVLASQPGFMESRVLHFCGGGYRYLYEMVFADRASWEQFFDGQSFRLLRDILDPHLTVPFGVQIHRVR